LLVIFLCLAPGVSPEGDEPLVRTGAATFAMVTSLYRGLVGCEKACNQTKNARDKNQGNRARHLATKEATPKYQVGS